MEAVLDDVNNMEKLRARISGPSARMSKSKIHARTYGTFNGILIEERLFKRISLLKNEGVPEDVNGRTLLFVPKRTFGNTPVKV